MVQKILLVLGTITAIVSGALFSYGHKIASIWFLFTTLGLLTFCLSLYFHELYFPKQLRKESKPFFLSSLSKKTGFIWGGFILLIFVYLALCLYLQGRVTNGEVFVTPSCWNVAPGRTEYFIMKLTNNGDIPIFSVNLVMKIPNGDLKTDSIKVKLLEESKLTTELGDEKGKVIISWDMVQLHGFTIPEHIPMIELIINNLNAHTTKEFSVTIDANQIKEKSTILLNVTRYDKTPPKVIKGRQRSKLPSKELQ